MSIALPLAEPHVAAVVARLELDVPAVGELGQAPPITDANPKGYAVYPDAGDVEDARLCGDRSKITIRFWIHAIGRGPEQALWVADRIRLAMLGAPVEVEGRKTYRMFQTDESPLMRDDDVEPKLYLQAVEYELTSLPSSQ